jgi:hypothetical protein
VEEEFDAPRSSIRSVLPALVVLAAMGGGLVFVATELLAPVYDPAELVELELSTDAEIISVQKTGDRYEGLAVYDLELQVSPAGERSYRVFHKQPFAAADDSKLHKTTKIRVKIDPTQKRRLWVTEIAVEDPN